MPMFHENLCHAIYDSLIDSIPHKPGNGLRQVFLKTVEKKTILNLLKTFEGFKKGFCKTILKPFTKIRSSNHSGTL